MASRSLDALAQPVKTAAQGLLTAASAQGITLLIYCTLRSREEQAALYASGRTVEGPILTNAPPGMSLHNPDGNGQAWAFDAVPIINGKALWNDKSALTAMGVLGEAQGLQWAGRWRYPLRESVHFQIKPGNQK